MGLNENIAATIRTVMKRQNKSLAAFSDEIGISKTALHDYVRGRGNPSVSTLEHIAENLGVSPAALMTGQLNMDQRGIALLLLDTVQSIAELPEEKRIRFAELFLEMVNLWNGE